MGVSRRSFLKDSVAATAAATMSGGFGTPLLGARSKSLALTPGPGNKWPGRVAVNLNRNSVTGSGISTSPVESVIKAMVDDTVMQLTGENSVGTAWKAIFPASLNLQSKVAIKVNIANNADPTVPSPFLVMGITNGLQQMDFGGTPFPPGNIKVYDANNNFSSEFYNTRYTSARFPNITCIHYGGNENTPFQSHGDGALDDRPYAPALAEADFLINVFSLRGHWECGEGFTLGYKSHFGSYYNARVFHPDDPEKIRDINCIGPVYNKTVLSVCCGIFGMYEWNGPFGSAQDFSGYTTTLDPTAPYHPSTILMSTDPVSAEVQSIKMIRLSQNGVHGVSDMPRYLRASAGVSDALSGTNYNMGVIDESDMDIRRIVNGSPTPVWKGRPRSGGSDHSGDGTLHIKKKHNTTLIECVLPPGSTGSNLCLEVYGAGGTLVHRQSRRAPGALGRFVWDERGPGGKRVGPGSYTVRLSAGATRLSTTLPIFR